MVDRAIDAARRRVPAPKELGASRTRRGGNAALRLAVAANVAADVSCPPRNRPPRSRREISRAKYAEDGAFTAAPGPFQGGGVFAADGKVDGFCPRARLPGVAVEI